jgi:hypothetical protein
VVVPLREALDASELRGFVKKTRGCSRDPGFTTELLITTKHLLLAGNAEHAVRGQATLMRISTELRERRYNAF